jgi:hypothetical protein
MTTTLDVIIVNWNAGEPLRDCLLSIEDAERSGFNLTRLMVVDNGSTDGSLDATHNPGLPLTVIHNPENRGFAAACNQGAKQSKADYLLFLNPDTRLFRDTLSKPIQFMQKPENAHVGICGVRQVDDFGVTTISCARFPSLRIFFGKMTGLSRILPRVFPSHVMSSGECLHSSIVDQVIGAFFLVRKSLYDLIGGFDERFFVYFEEVDFALRAKRKGYSSYYLGDALLYHKGAGSSEKIKAKRLFYSLRSRIQFGFKHFSLPEALALLMLTLSLELMARISLAIFSLSKSRLNETIMGYSQLIVCLLAKGWK